MYASNDYRLRRMDMARRRKMIEKKRIYLLGTLLVACVIGLVVTTALGI